jgi:hypothetical protein
MSLTVMQIAFGLYPVLGGDIIRYKNTSHHNELALANSVLLEPYHH